MTGKRLLCVGEALVDVVEQKGQTTEHVGGSLLNVSAGLARLGHDTTIQAWFGSDERGQRISAAASSAGVQVAPGSTEAERTPVAYASVDEAGRAQYTFDLEWRLPTRLDLADFDHLHTGSIACTLEPGGSTVVESVRQMREHGTVSYDPNVRPALMGSSQQVRPRIEELIALSDVVKASDEDIAWLYGGEVPLEAVLRRWLAMGPSLVVITRGPLGAMAALAGDDDVLKLDQMNVDVADTVGAGDSFMAGLISGLTDVDLLGSREAAQRLAAAKWADVQAALHRAVGTSAVTVSKAGAYAPDRDELASQLENRRALDDSQYFD